MKKILSLILACVLYVSAMSVTAFADTATTDGLFGVITDAEGNVVEILTMPRSTYVNSIYTIPANGYLTTYQYEPTENFVFGVSPWDSDRNYIATSNSTLTLSIERANSIGASSRQQVKSGNLSIDISKKSNGQYITCNVTESSYRYYNGKVKNQSSVSATVRIIVASNLNDDDWDIIETI